MGAEAAVRFLRKEQVFRCVGLFASSRPRSSHSPLRRHPPAQFYGGYGPFGGLDWYGYGGAGSTVQGDIARGQGLFLIGAGSYNYDTARAGEIEAETLRRLNQDAYRSQQAANRANRQRHQSRQFRIVQARERTDQRLRDNPTPRDIASGEALNVVHDKLRDRGASLSALKGGRTRLRSALVREIPFQYASEGITIRVNRLLQETPPPVLTNVAFAAEMKALEQFTEELRTELAERNELHPETVDRGLDLIRTTWVKVEAALPARSAAWRDAVAYLKELSGLCRLLGTPAATVLLGGTEGVPRRGSVSC